MRELNVYHHELRPNEYAEFYLKYEADKVIAEKDKEISELKARIQLDDDEIAGFLQLEEECGGGDLRNYIAELKAKLEDVQASAYAEMVDAGMRERRLRRALWLARAERAKEKQQLFHFSLSYEKLCIDGFYNPSSGRRELSPTKWIKVFKKVEFKCRVKAEEYR